MYPALHHQHALLHVTPLFDQQLAGFVAKFGAYVPMWWVAFVIFSRAEEQGTPTEETPLHWADVERELLRVDRQRARTLRHHRAELRPLWYDEVPGDVAQLVERGLCKPEVVGSIPIVSTSRRHGCRVLTVGTGAEFLQSTRGLWGSTRAVHREQENPRSVTSCRTASRRECSFDRWPSTSRRASSSD